MALVYRGSSQMNGRDSPLEDDMSGVQQEDTATSTGVSLPSILPASPKRDAAVEQHVDSEHEDKKPAPPPGKPRKPAAAAPQTGARTIVTNRRTEDDSRDRVAPQHRKVPDPLPLVSPTGAVTAQGSKEVESAATADADAQASMTAALEGKLVKALKVRMNKLAKQLADTQAALEDAEASMGSAERRAGLEPLRNVGLDVPTDITTASDVRRMLFKVQQLTKGAFANRDKAVQELRNAIKVPPASSVKQNAIYPLLADMSRTPASSWTPSQCNQVLQLLAATRHTDEQDPMYVAAQAAIQQQQHVVAQALLFERVMTTLWDVKKTVLSTVASAIEALPIIEDAKDRTARGTADTADDMLQAQCSAYQRLALETELENSRLKLQVPNALRAIHRQLEALNASLSAAAATAAQRTPPRTRLPSQVAQSSPTGSGHTLLPLTLDVDSSEVTKDVVVSGIALHLQCSLSSSGQLAIQATDSEHSLSYQLRMTAEDLINVCQAAPGFMTHAFFDSTERTIRPGHSQDAILFIVSLLDLQPSGAPDATPGRRFNSGRLSRCSETTEPVPDDFDARSVVSTDMQSGFHDMMGQLIAESVVENDRVRHIQAHGAKLVLTLASAKLQAPAGTSPWDTPTFGARSSRRRSSSGSSSGSSLLAATKSFEATVPPPVTENLSRALVRHTSIVAQLPTVPHAPDAGATVLLPEMEGANVASPGITAAVSASLFWQQHEDSNRWCAQVQVSVRCGEATGAVTLSADVVRSLVSSVLGPAGVITFSPAWLVMAAHNTSSEPPRQLVHIGKPMLDFLVQRLVVCQEPSAEKSQLRVALNASASYTLLDRQGVRVGTRASLVSTYLVRAMRPANPSINIAAVDFATLAQFGGVVLIIVAPAVLEPAVIRLPLNAAEFAQLRLDAAAWRTYLTNHFTWEQGCLQIEIGAADELDPLSE